MPTGEPPEESVPVQVPSLRVPAFEQAPEMHASPSAQHFPLQMRSLGHVVPAHGAMQRCLSSPQQPLFGVSQK